MALRSAQKGFFARWLEQIGQLGQMIGETLYHLAIGNVDLRDTFKQMVTLGVDSIPIVLVISGFTGMVFSLQVSQEFDRFGAASLIGRLLGMAVTREFGPVLTGVVVAGRAGSAIAAELGTMKVTEQVDALRALAESPVQYLVAPRFLACAVMVPVLTVFAILIGTAGGYFVAVHQVGIVPAVFIESMTTHLVLWDLVGSMIKAAVFGVLIAVVSCYRGLQTERGAQGVGDSTIASVVTGMISIFVTNYVLSALLY